MSKLFGKDWISLAYVHRYDDTRRIDWWAKQFVHIESDKGIWRPGGSGYTADRQRAGVWDFAKAVRETSHCGPEKGVRYLLIDKREQS